METAVVIKDLPAPTDLERKETVLTPERMKSIVGGASAVARSTATESRPSTSPASTARFSKDAWRGQ